MPRDMTGTGRYPPTPKFEPFSFYTCFRLGDPEQLALIMETDPYYWTQDNGAGGPVHFSTTYKQIDMLHHVLRNCPEAVNQRDPRGFTPLHRAAYLAQYDGYMELYEYLLTEGADPTIRTNDYDPYLNPGLKTSIQVAIDDEEIRGKLIALHEKYAHVPKRPEPHKDLSDWWACYDYGFDTVRKWPKDFQIAEKREFKKKRAEARAKYIADYKEKEEAAFNETVAALSIDAAAGSAAAAAGSKPAAVAAGAAPAPIAFLFPGQGSQAVGMLKSLADDASVKKMFDTAKDVLGYDLLDVCVNGPKEKLDDTVYSQPALFVAGLAAVEKLKKDDPSVVAKCAACAGLSLGEYTALVFSGALSFEDGLKVVKVRAESMAAAAKVGDHGMLSVVGLADDVLHAVVADAKKAIGGECVCDVANYLFPQGRVVSGDKNVLEEVTKLATAKGAMKCSPVAVSGAFHTSRMQSAKDALVDVLKTVTFHTPTVPIYSNVTGKIVDDVAAIPELLARQLVSPVMWESTVKNLLEDNKDELYELGPNTQIKSMTRRISPEAWKKFKNVDVTK